VKHRHPVLAAVAVVKRHFHLAVDDGEHRVAEIPLGHQHGIGRIDRQAALRREMVELPRVEGLGEQRNGGEYLASVVVFHASPVAKPQRGAS